MMNAPAAPAPYPVRFEVEHPERQSRWKALFRIPLALPAFIFVGLALFVAYLALPVMWVAILVRGRIPRWLFDFQVGVNRFNARVNAYAALLTDEYPAFDGDYPVRYHVTYPRRISRRRLIFWKIAASIPQWIAVTVLQYASFALVAVGWLVILLTGTFPKGLHQFVVGVSRWRERVYAYTISLTDEYPPYSMSANAPAATGVARTASTVFGVLGIAAIAGFIALVIVAVPWRGEEHTIHVSYQRLVDEGMSFQEASLEVNGVGLDLLSAVDPADETLSLITPLPGHRLVTFSFFLTSHKRSNELAPVFARDFDLRLAGSDKDPVLAIVGRRSSPVVLYPGDSVEATVVFELPVGVVPESLLFRRGRLVPRYRSLRVPLASHATSLALCSALW